MLAQTAKVNLHNYEGAFRSVCADDAYSSLAKRLGEVEFQRRLRIQQRSHTLKPFQKKWKYWLSRTFSKDWLVYLLFDIVGFYERGNFNYLNLRVQNTEFTLKNLSQAFDGFRILHLTDLHFGIDSQITPVLIKHLKDLRYDLAVVTGDFHDFTHDNHAFSIADTVLLLNHLQAPVYGVLGNHDPIEIVPFLERYGIQILLNEGVEVKRGNESIFVAGIDDPSRFGTHNISRSIHKRRDGQTTILLSHSPKTYADAEALGIDLVLSGHTHGGQICLPGRVPLMKKDGIPIDMIAGTWRRGRMQGYTSRGVGASCVPIRLFSPPELSLITLRTPKQQEIPAQAKYE